MQWNLLHVLHLTSNYRNRWVIKMFPIVIGNDEDDLDEYEDLDIIEQCNESSNESSNDVGYGTVIIIIIVSFIITLLEIKYKICYI